MYQNNMFPVNIYPFKVNNRNTRERYENVNNVNNKDTGKTLLHFI